VTDDRPDLTVLDEAECWRLLGSVAVGRVAMEAAEGLVVVPVNYAVQDGDVVFRTTEGGLLGSAADWGRPVAFQVDSLDEGIRQGWSVLVRGELRRASEQDTPRLVELVAPWARGERNVVGRVKPSAVSGRRIGAGPGHPTG
jgi:nitroimidazol reductase NimA-like FMN-containing flavoprotein (pyridoxamine 5'-phosphate oxidase superfamily)